MSPFSAERIFKLATLSLKEILYFRPTDTSFPSRSHLTLRSGLPDTVHSKVAECPAVTLMDGAFSTILAGSEIFKKGEKILIFEIFLSLSALQIFS